MGFECLEKCLRTSFRGYGRLVARHPKMFLLTPLLATGFLSLGFIAFRIETDIAALFTVPGALSRREITVMRQFSRTGSGVAAGGGSTAAADSSFSKTTNKSQNDQSRNSGDSEFRWFDFFSLNKDGRNIFTSDVLLEISEHLAFVYDNLTCYAEQKDDGSIEIYKYANFCHSENGCLRMDKTYQTLAKFLSPRYASNSAISLTYPSMSVYGKSSVWAELLRGVTLDKNNVVIEVRVFIAPLQFQYDRNRIPKKILDRCMHTMADYFWNSESRNNLTFYASYEQMFIDELQKTQQYSLPWLSLSVFLVAAFCTLSTVEGCKFWDKKGQHSQISEAGYGLLTIGMSLVAGFGFLFICSYSYNFVVSCTPFVALCVSVDNDFMLLAAWRRTSPHQSVAGRLGEAFADAGPSLTITSLTDILCFAIGSVSAVAAVSTFCLFTAVTLTFRYIFQMTFFAAVICYSNLEGKDARKSSPFYRTFFCSCFSNSKNDKSKNGGSSPEVDSEHFMHRFFRVYWTKFLVCRLARILLMMLYAVYMIFSLVMTSKLVINITPVRVLAEDSKLVPVFNSGETYSGTSSIIGHAFVLKPPDFRYKANRTLINSLVEELKRTKYYSNETSTIQMWFFDYLNYYNYMTGSDSAGSDDGKFSMGNDDLFYSSSDPNSTSNSSDSIAFESNSGYKEEFYSYLADFFSAEAYKKYASDIHWKAAKNPYDPNIESFVFKLYHRNVITWDDHVHLMLHWRQACAQFPQLDAMVVDRNSLNPYMDERLSVAPTTLQTMGIALLSMMVATGLMMPDVTGMFYITLSFLSVDVGVVGFLNLWRCDLDLTTMTGILMTIGFSVYYTARVCYGYQTTFSITESKDQSRHPTRKLSETMGAVGWPVLQGGVGTVLGIAPLAIVPCYVTRTFFKTIVLVVCAGLFHGLMIMPIMMTSLDTNVTKSDRRKKRLMWKTAGQARQN